MLTPVPLGASGGARSFAFLVCVQFLAPLQRTEEDNETSGHRQQNDADDEQFTKAKGHTIPPYRTQPVSTYHDLRSIVFGGYNRSLQSPRPRGLPPGNTDNQHSDTRQSLAVVIARARSYH